MKKIIVILVLIIIAAAGYYYIKFTDFYTHIYSESKNPLFNKPPEEQHIFNILLMGYGGIDESGRAHDGTYLTDTMMVIRLDLKKKKALFISLPRDICIKIPTESKSSFHGKINAVYQMGLFNKNYPDIPKKFSGEEGAGDLVKLVIEQIIGEPIDYYAVIDFEGFKKAVDILGGVDINVERSFDDYEYPIAGKKDELCGRDEEFEQIKDFIKPPFNEEERDKLFKDKPELEEFVKNATETPNLAFPCRYEHLHFDAGEIRMDGETALKYVRSRHSLQDGNDFGRAARQQLFLQAMRDKIINIGFIPKIIPLLDEMKTRIKLDIPADVLKKFLAEANKSEDYKIDNIILTNKKNLTDYMLTPCDGYSLIPKSGLDQWDEINKYINNVAEEITPTPIKASTESEDLD